MLGHRLSHIGGAMTSLFLPDRQQEKNVIIIFIIHL